MRKTIIAAVAAAVIMSMAANHAQSEILQPLQLLDPTSPLAERAVDLALREFEARGLDQEYYTAEVYTTDSLVYVIFERTLLSEEDDDSTPALTLEVVLSKDAGHVVEAYFAK